MVTRSEAKRVLVIRVSSRLIILFWGPPEPANWKSAILFILKE